MEDIVKLIYPGDSTADHIMKGSAYNQTLRSHYITENGAASTFDETELSSNAFENNSILLYSAQFTTGLLSS